MTGQTTGATRVTGVLAAIAVVSGVVYLGPGFWYQRTLPGAQLGIVSTVESWWPVWPIAFLAAGVMLGWSCATKRHVALSHSIASGVWCCYATAVLLSAVYSEPPGPVLAASIALGASALHLAMIRVWADLGVR